jgi:hypothetical protein
VHRHGGKARLGCPVKRNNNLYFMKNFKVLVTVIACVFVIDFSKAQEIQEIQTVFRQGAPSGGYGAITNKFSMINGQFANIAGISGGWYVNHWFMIGVGAAATTNNLPVPIQYSADPSRNLSYQYGQFGLATEYVIGSGKAVHLAFSLFSGAGFTLQYERYNHFDNYNYSNRQVHNENWFFVAEPGVQLEINLLKWMRFSPGVSYRTVVGSKADGLRDQDLSNVSYNATLKFGKF